MKRKMIFGVAVFVALGGSGVSWIAAQDSDPPELSCASGELRQTDHLHWSADFQGYATAREAVADQAPRSLRLQRGDDIRAGREDWAIWRGTKRLATVELAQLPNGRYLVEEVTMCAGDVRSP